MCCGTTNAIGSLPAKAAIMQQYCTCENNQVTPYWNYAENIKDGRGITFGFIGFTTATYDGNILIKHYTTMNPDNVLAKYIPALDAIDNGPHNDDADHDGNNAVTGLDNFIQDVNSINDPLWAQAQLWLFNSMYWDIAVGQANSIGAQYEVTLGVIYDANGRHGEDVAQALIDQTTAAMGGTPATGVNEIAWLNEFIAIRDMKLQSENLGDQDRQNGYKEDIAAGNYNLVTPYVIHTYGDPYTIDGILGVDLGGGVGLGTGKSPVASFTSAAAGLSVAFTDKSSNTPTSWSWVFGDESTVTAENSKQNPSHTYTAEGTYQVKLTATSAEGSNSITIPVTVNVPVAKPVAFFSYSPTTVVHRNVVTFTDSSTNCPTRWKWTFSDTRTTVITTTGKTTHTFRRAGTYTVSLVSSNSAGSSTSVLQSIKVS
jgi:chitosanase